MAFDYSIITNSGMSILSAVSATKTLVIDDVYPIATLETEAHVQSQPPSYFAALADSGVDASIASVGVDPNSTTNSRIVVELALASQITVAHTIKTIVICGHTEDTSGEGDLVTFVGALDDAGVSIPYNAQAPLKIQLAFSFAFNRASSVTASSSVPNYLLASEVERFVTTHSTSSTQSGEYQEIYGEKTFNDDVYIASSLRLTNNASNVSMAVYDAYPNVLVNLYGANGASETGTYLEIDDNNGDVMAQLSSDGSNYYLGVDVVKATSYVETPKISSSSDVVIDADYLYPRSATQQTLAASLGDASHIWTSAFVGITRTGVINSIINNSAISVLADVNMSGKALRASTITATGTITASNFAGLMPYATQTSSTQANIPVGGLVALHITQSTSTSLSMIAGATVTTDSSAYSLRIAKTLLYAGSVPTSGTYVLLSDVETTSQYGTSVALAIRIS